MSQTWKIVIVVVLIISIIVVLTIKRNQSAENAGSDTDSISLGQIDPASAPAEYRPEQLVGKGLPVMIDLGSDQCIPCKMMTPILEELKSKYVGTLAVHFLDVRKLPALSKLYKIQLIPTQIFYDASGKELFRHEGFYAKEDILAKWKELGIDIQNPVMVSPIE